MGLAGSLGSAGAGGTEPGRWRGAAGELSPGFWGHRSCTMCRPWRAPRSQQAMYWVREVLCQVWLPCLAPAQSEYGCWQSRAVSCAQFLLFAVPDTCCGLGPGFGSRGGVPAGQDSTLQSPSVPSVHWDVIFVPCPPCSLLALGAGSFCFQNAMSACSAAAALQVKKAR